MPDNVVNHERSEAGAHLEPSPRLEVPGTAGLCRLSTEEESPGVTCAHPPNEMPTLGLA